MAPPVSPPCPPRGLLHPLWGTSGITHPWLFQRAAQPFPAAGAGGSLVKVWDEMGGALPVLGDVTWCGLGGREGLGGRTEWIGQEFWQGVGAVLDRDPGGFPRDTPGAVSGISEWELSVLSL